MTGPDRTPFYWFVRGFVEGGIAAYSFVLVVLFFAVAFSGS